MHKGKKNDEFRKVMVDTVIGEKTLITGSISSKDRLVIDGEISGNIDSSSDVIISVSGYVKGDVVSNNVVIGGEVVGDIVCENKLEILSSGRLTGNCMMKALIIDENGKFNGTAHMDEGSDRKESSGDGIVDLDKGDEI